MENGSNLKMFGELCSPTGAFSPLLDKSKALLQLAEQIWSREKIRHRNVMIQVGGILQQFIVERVQQGDGLNEAEQIAQRLRREQAIAEASKCLHLDNHRLNELITVHAVVSLLSAPSGDIGQLSYSALRWFRVAVQRTKGILCRARVKKPGEIWPSEREVWRIRSGLEEKAKNLFQRAVAEGWNEGKIRKALAEAKLVQDRPSVCLNFNPDTKKIFNPITASKVATPKDVTEMVVEMIENSSDPESVVYLLEQELKKLKRKVLI